MPVIQLEDIRKCYHVSDTQDVHALRGVSLVFEAGEFAAIMGPSGSGKSTLLNVLGGLDRPTSGTYHLDGEEVVALEPDRLAAVRNEKIGFVFQNFNLLSRTTALENIELPMMYNRQGFTLKEIQRRAREGLEMVGLADRASHYPSQLSGGQQQRVAIARALVNRPAVLLADEPSGNLDSRTTLEIMEIFQRLNAQGILIVMVTHEPEIGQYAHRVITMRDGRVCKDVPVAEPFVASREKERLPADTREDASDE